MTDRPRSWRLIVRRLTRAVPPDALAAILGDLAEDFRSDRRAGGWLRAEWRAWRDAGSIARAYRPARRPRFDGWRFDLRLATRAALRQPGLTATVVLPLAFAVAANTALFSILDGLLFRPLPFRNTEELVALRVADSSAVRDRYTTFVDFIRGTAESPLLAGVSLASASSAFPADAAADLDLAPAAVSSGFFGLLGLQLISGRDFRPDDNDDNEDGRPLAVILGHEVWHRLFGGDPTLLGRVVTLAGRPIEVVGILPPGRAYPLGANVWVPAGEPIRPNGLRFWQVARLSPGVSLDRLRRRYPDLAAGPLRDSVQPKGTEALVFLLGATGLFLLAAWVQIGALVLARATHRAGEVGIRLALGAGPLRLIRQYLIEAALFASLALALAWLATPVLTALLAGQLPRQMTVGQSIAPDLRTFAFAAAVSGLGALLLAVAPIELVRRASPSLLFGGGAAGLTARTERVRSTLLVVQVACSSLLLCVAGLAFHSFVRVSRADVGFEPARLWQFSVPSLPAGLSDTERQAVRSRRMGEVDEALRQLGSLTDVSAAGAAAAPPLSKGTFRGPLRSPAGEDLSLEPWANPVTPGYLRALGARLSAGRFPEPAGGPEAPGEFIVNDTLARALARTGPVLDRDLRIAGFRGRVVGVIDDLVNTAPGVPAEPQMFLPLTSGLPGVLIVRTASGGSSRAALEGPLLRVWGASAPSRLSPVSDDVARLMAPWRARTVLFGLIAALCVPLVAAGITGALYAAVRARTREIAVRLALGAEARSVHRMVVGRALGLTGLGLAAGLTGGVAAGHLMASQLFGIRPADAATLAGVGAGVLTVAWLAALLPARRAAAIAPAAVLNDR